MRRRIVYRTKKQRRQLIAYGMCMIMLVILIVAGINIYQNRNYIFEYVTNTWKQLNGTKDQKPQTEVLTTKLEGDIYQPLTKVNSDFNEHMTVEAEITDLVLQKQREVRMDKLMVNERMNSGDFVDIRIRYPNGEEYILLENKQIIVDTVNPDKKVLFLSMLEEEILFYSSALYDLAVYPESRLYPVKYQTVIKDLKDDTVSTNYIPHVDVIEMMYENSVISETEKHCMIMKRNRIDQRIQDFLGVDIADKQKNKNDIIDNEIEGVWIYE